MCEKICIWNPSTCTYENDKNLGNIIGDSVIMYDENMEQTKTVPTKSTSTKIVPTIGTSTNFYILLIFFQLAQRY